MRAGHAVEHPVVADPGDVGCAAGLEAGQQPLLGEAGVHAEHGDLAHRAFEPIDQVEDKVECALGGVRVAGAQPGIEHVAGLRRAGDDRMVHALLVVAVPG